ncbi:MAG: metallophosphoesterase [Flavobacteriales bacterium]
MKLFLSLLTAFIVFFGLQYYSIQTILKMGWLEYSKWWYYVVLILVYGIIIGLMVAIGPRSPHFTKFTALFLLLIVPQIIMLLFGVLGDLGLFITKLISGNENSASRRKFVGQTILALGSIPFLGILHGIAFGKYNFKKIRHKVGFANLPKAFEGYKILHISDIHVGSLDNKEQIKKAVQMSVDEKPDLVLFTGDLVNHSSKEVEGWEDILNKFIAKDGLYAVLGNHDYSPYTEGTPEEKKIELEKTKDKYHELGFKLLNNENTLLKRGEDAIRLLGVEYWGNTMKDQPGDLDLALQGVDKDEFKILMSHDPSHVEKIVFPHDVPFELSLSGHTHGMQFGIEIPGWIKWSPIQYVYKYWAGMYQNNGQFLNVNRGFGFHAYSGRTGIWPELSIITLTHQT